MVIIAIISLILGAILGHNFFSPQIISTFSNVSDIALILLMFSVGISVGTNKDVFSKMKGHGIKILIIPTAIIVGSIIGGFVCGIILNMPYKESLPIACGLGWYSLSGVLITNLAGAHLGTIAFLSNLLREILSFLIIPFVAKHFNRYTAIAPAAATSEDTCLAILIKYTDAEIIMLAVVNGILCSTAVPILINFFYNIF